MRRSICDENTMTPTLRIQTWTLERIAAAIDGTLASPDYADRRPRAVSTDTRALAGGELFFALSGANFDAHDFLDDLAARHADGRGVCAAVVARGRRESSDALPLIEVDDPEEALRRLAHALWREATDAGLHTVAVTGSNGKTTTKEILARLWSLEGRVHATRGNFNNLIGLPLTLCELPLKCDHVILEMGANSPIEIAQLIRIAPAHVRVVTSIGFAHVEGFGGIEGVRRAKSQIFEAADVEAAAVVPHSEKDELLLEGFAGRVVTFGPEPGADVRYAPLAACAGADSGEPGGEGQRVELQANSRKWALSLPLPGVHNASNLAAAVATLIARGIEPDEDALDACLEALQLPAGRWRREEVGELCFIDDAYNANPSSVAASVDAFAALTLSPGLVRRIVVIGEMRELGPQAERLHRAVARHVAKTPDIAAFAAVGKFAPAMAEEARACRSTEGCPGDAGTFEVLAAEGHEEVADWLGARPHSLVLLKASRGSRLERIIEIVRR